MPFYQTIELFFNINKPLKDFIMNLLSLETFNEDEKELNYYLYIIFTDYNDKINLLMPFFNSVEFTPDPKYINVNNTALNIIDLIIDFINHCKNKDYFYYLDEENNFYPYNYEEDMINFRNRCYEEDQRNQNLDEE